MTQPTTQQQPEPTDEQRDRDTLRAAPRHSDDWDDETWGAWWRHCERVHGDAFDQFEKPQQRQARWEAAAQAAGREVDRNALRVYMAVADAERRALAEDWARSAESTDAELRRLRADLLTLEQQVDTAPGEINTALLATIKEVRDLLHQSRTENDQLRAELAAVIAVHEKGEHNGLPICLHCASQMYPPPETGIWSESAYPCATLRALGISDDAAAPASA